MWDYIEKNTLYQWQWFAEIFGAFPFVITLIKQQYDTPFSYSENINECRIDPFSKAFDYTAKLYNIAKAHSTAGNPYNQNYIWSYIR